MKDDVAIRVSGLSKKYEIGKQKDGSLRGSLASIFSSSAKAKDEFWALRDVNFEVKKGEVIGIIGKNGAGKSTLLKVLSQITKPTEGRIEINGRVASLLEVGTGFHPELTGRENVYLNGTILGMTRKEVAEKFDEIVAFSGVEKFIDTPVKHYSSGMYVRLAFAVAAHLEPEILIIDEVLAVGDAEFQKKCLGKMKDVAGEGRTVIFVSHNMAAVRELCDIGIYLEGGIVKKGGPISKLIDSYLNEDKILIKTENNTEIVKFHDVYITSDGTVVKHVVFKQGFTVSGKVNLEKNLPANTELCLSFINRETQRVFSNLSSISDMGQYEFSLEIEGGLLVPNKYSILLQIYSDEGKEMYNETILSNKLEILNTTMEFKNYTEYGFFHLKSDLQLNKTK